LAVILAVHPLNAQRKLTVSVMDLNAASGLSQSELILLTDKLLSSLVEYRVFEVVERSKRNEILKEQGFQMTGACSEASCLVEVGQLLGAQKMIGGTIGKLGNVFVVELRMIDIQTGAIDLSFSRNYGKMTDLLTAMKEAAEIFSSWRPSAGGQTAKPGGLFISSEPEGAKIMVDGRELGKTTPDLVYPLSEGLHQISLIKEGFSLFSASHLVSIGKVDTVKAPLLSLAGKLRIKVRPAGAKFYLNKAYQGMVNEQGLTIDGLTDSLYKVKATKYGYRTYKADVITVPGRETKMDVRLPLRRWKLIPFSFEFMKNQAARDQSEGTFFVISGTSPDRVAHNDIVGHGFGGTAGVGFAINRNITLGLLYQFRVYPGAFEKEIHSGGWPDTLQYYDQLHVNFLSHSSMLSLSAAIPWNVIEPFMEARFGLSVSAKSQLQYRHEVMKMTSTSPEVWTPASSDTLKEDRKVGYRTLQAGGGILLWLRPDRWAFRLYCLYSREVFADFSLPKDYPWTVEDTELIVSGLIFGGGLVVHF